MYICNEDVLSCTFSALRPANVFVCMRACVRVRMCACACACACVCMRLCVLGFEAGKASKPSYGYSLVQGRRPYMEDLIYSSLEFGADKNSCFFGCFDGHWY